MRLATRITLSIAALVAVFSLLSALFISRLVERQIHHSHTLWAQALTRSIAESVARNTLNRDVLTTRETLLDIVRQTPHLKYAYVTDFDERVFAHTFDSGFPSALLSVAASAQGGAGHSEFIANDERIQEFVSPLVEGLDAMLHLGISYSESYAPITEMRAGIVAIALPMVLFSTLLAIFLGRRLGRPLARLAAQMDAYGEQRLSEPADLPSADHEVRHLFASFRRMVADRERGEAQLVASEARLKAAQRIAHLGNWEWDIPGGTLWWSDEIYRIFKLSPRQFAASYEAFLDRVHPDDRGAVSAAVDDALRDAARDYAIAHRIVRADGSVRIVQEQGRVERNELGSPIRMFGTVQDITERRQAEDELEQHRRHLEELVARRTSALREQAQIIDDTHDSIVTTDLEGRVLTWNGGAQRLFGFSREEAIGRHIGFVYPKEQQGFLETAVIAPLKSKGFHDVEAQMRRKGGERFYAHLSLSLLKDADGQPKGLIGYTIDITDRKRQEAETRRVTSRLAETNRELEAFSYSVSHDLRAPLRAIDGFSQALVEDHAQQLDDTARDYLVRVRRAAQHMGRLIDDLLALSRVTRKTIECGPVDLTACSRQVVRQLASASPGRAVDVDIEPNMRAHADRGLLQLVLENLIGNAWKYSSTRPRAHIAIGCSKRDGDTAFHVRDDGVGFDMRHAGKLFGPFQRLHRSEEFEGTGIGLATVQRIVARHGGRVWAEGEVDRGATFYFTLPGGGDDAAGKAEGDIFGNTNQQATGETDGTQNDIAGGGQPR